MNVNLLLDRLDKAKSSGNNRWVACCPAHDDKSPSLQISQVGDRILIHCFAGCGANEVLNSVGLDFDVLYPDGKEERKPTHIKPVDEIFCTIYKMKVKEGVKPQQCDTDRYMDILNKKYR